MVQSVELLLDEALDDWVWCQWRALESAGLPSQVRHGSLTNWPHVTLGVADSIAPELESALSDAVAELPIPIQLGGVIWFPGKRHVIARSVVPSAELIAMHARVHAILDGPAMVGRRMTPGTWTPHVTLARGVRPEQLGAVVDCLAGVDGIGKEPVGIAHTARRWDSDAKITWDL